MIGGSPAIWAWAIGFICATALTALVIRLYRQLPDDVVFMPLILAPPGLLFFAYDTSAAFRKEILGYVAIALVLSAAFSRTRRALVAWIMAGTSVFLFALFLHEVNLFLWPALALALWIAAAASSSLPSSSASPAPNTASPSAALTTSSPAAPFLPRYVFAGVAGATLIVGIYIIVMLKQMPVPDIAAICRAAQSLQCGEPYQSLQHDADAAFAYTFGRRKLWEIPAYIIYLALGLAPFWFMQRVKATPVRPIYMALVLLLAVSPLFVMAFDWGRWLHMALMPMNMLAITAIALGYLRFQPNLPAWIPVGYVLLWNLPHAIPTYGPNALSLAVMLGLIMLGHRLWQRVV